MEELFFFLRYYDDSRYKIFRKRIYSVHSLSTNLFKLNESTAEIPLTELRLMEISVNRVDNNVYFLCHVNDRATTGDYFYSVFTPIISNKNYEVYLSCKCCKNVCVKDFC